MEKKGRKQMKKKLKNTKGITLIALVITIIVLLILAGVTIATLTGDNGILTRASDASRENEIASVKEQAELDITNWVAGELENGRDSTVNTPEKVKEILDTANQNNGNKYYNGYTDTGVKTPNGYEVPFEELYTNNSTEGGITEISVANYGDKVDYISKGDSSLIWRIFYDDENYVYLISSKEDGSNTVEYCKLSEYPGSSKTYSGSADITDSFLQSLNSQWFSVLGNTPNTGSTGKAVAYLMDQDVWDEYKDSEENASYAIGGPTLELFIKSYNATSKQNAQEQEIKISSCNTTGYLYNKSSGWLSTRYGNGIYNNDGWWLASPYVNYQNNCIYIVKGDEGYFSNNYVNQRNGLRPMVIIPKSNFTYQIIEESE